MTDTVNHELLEQINHAIDRLDHIVTTAHNNGYQTCCGQYINENGQCCGIPDIEWHDEDQHIIECWVPILHTLQDMRYEFNSEQNISAKMHKEATELLQQITVKMLAE